MDTAPRSLLILGTRTLAVDIADLAADIPGVRVAGFVENMERARCREKIEGLPVHWVDDLVELANSHCAVCGLATTHRNRFVEQVAVSGVPFATLVHPSASVSPKCSIGEGSVISRGVIIAAHARLGRHVFVNRGTLIGHHTEISEFTTVQPGANIAGVCHIGEGTYIGMGAMVIDHVTIGAHSVVGAGALVIKNVPDNAQVVGAPARVVKRNICGK